MNNLYDLHHFQALPLFYLKPTLPSIFLNIAVCVTDCRRSRWLPGQRTQPPISPSNPLRVIVLFDDHFCTSAWRLTRRSGRRGYLKGMSAPRGSEVLRPGHLSATSLTPHDFWSAWHVQTQDFSPASLLQRVRTCNKTWPDGETNNHWPSHLSSCQLCGCLSVKF